MVRGAILVRLSVGAQLGHNSGSIIICVEQERAVTVGDVRPGASPSPTLLPDYDRGLDVTDPGAII